jgi:TctA family transporter
MKNQKLKRGLDYIPFLVLVILFSVLAVKISTTENAFQWKHILGIILISINFFLFYRNHKAGVLALCVVLLTGLLGLISYDVSIGTYTFTICKDAEFQVPVFYGQPIFLLWLLLHFVLSFRYYVGILSKKYWVQLKEEFFNKNR